MRLLLRRGPLKFVLLLGLAAAVITAACSGGGDTRSVPADNPEPTASTQPEIGMPSETPESATSAPAKTVEEPQSDDADTPTAKADPGAEMAHRFTLPNASGGEVSLESYLGDSNVVVVFYRAFW